jgi:hypothetical protein
MAPIKKTPVKKTSIKKKPPVPVKNSVVKVKKPISKTKVAVGLAGLAALGTAAFLGNKYLKNQAPGTSIKLVQSTTTENTDSIILKQIEDLMKITNINDLNNECANLKNKNSKFHDKIVKTCKELIDKLSLPPTPPMSSSPRMSLLEQIQAGKSLKSAPTPPATPMSSSPRMSVSSSRTSVSSNLSDEIKKGIQLKKSGTQEKTIVKSDLIKRLEQARIANDGEETKEKDSEWV